MLCLSDRDLRQMRGALLLEGEFTLVDLRLHNKSWPEEGVLQTGSAPITTVLWYS